MKTQKYKGIIILETAIVLPLLILLIFGMIQYSWIMLKSQEVTNAARVGARTAVKPDSTTTEVTKAISDVMTKASLNDSGYKVTISPASAASGEPITVKVTVPVSNIRLLDLAILPMPDQLSSSTTMNKEGP